MEQYIRPTIIYNFVSSFLVSQSKLKMFKLFVLVLALATPILSISVKDLKTQIETSEKFLATGCKSVHHFEFHVSKVLNSQFTRKFSIGDGTVEFEKKACLVNTGELEQELKTDAFTQPIIENRNIAIQHTEDLVGTVQIPNALSYELVTLTFNHSEEYSKTEYLNREEVIPPFHVNVQPHSKVEIAFKFVTHYENYNYLTDFKIDEQSKFSCETESKEFKEIDLFPIMDSLTDDVFAKPLEDKIELSRYHGRYVLKNYLLIFAFNTIELETKIGEQIKLIESELESGKATC